MMKSSLQGEVEADVEIKAPATEFFHMFAARPQDVSKASPENVQGCNVQGGEMGRVGTLITWNYVLGKQNLYTSIIYWTLENVIGKNYVFGCRWEAESGHGEDRGSGS